MGKQIIVCMDGTWNDPTERTNVYKLFRLLPGEEQVIDADGPVRAHLRKESPASVAFYLEGVGAKGRHQGVLGGGLGVGLHDRVIDAGILVSRTWEPGDKIWIFGFSRGAWSARSLGSYLVKGGLLEQADADDAARRAEKLWFETRHGRGKAQGDRFWEARDPQPVRLLGVWDTVGALGIPLFNGLKLVDRIEQHLFDFADLDLSPRVQHGRHALAIDETRFDFTPTLWNPREGIEQVWFSGVHADVGGGYSHTGLSDIALEWMVQQVNALNAGLQLEIPPGFTQPDPLQDRHDEARKKIWRLRPRRPRAIPDTAQLHPSVFDRLKGRDDYRPAALASVPACAAWYTGGEDEVEEHLLPLHDIMPTRHLQAGESSGTVVFAQKWWNAAGLEVRAGETYLIEAQGQWQDRDRKIDANGYASDGWLLRFAESTRRLEQAEWFRLVVAVHADVDLEARNPTSENFLTAEIESLRRGVDGIDKASQQVPVGRRGTIEVDRDGFLYLFANDSDFAYANNSGYLEVTITRQ